MSEMAPAPAPHIVAIPLPIPGHINPLLHLCKKLQAFGFKITYVNSHENHKTLFNSHAPITKDGIQFIGIPDGVPEREEGAHPPSGMESVKVLVQSTDGMQPAMEELVDGMYANGNPVSCIISDSFIHWTQDIANKHGFPRVAFATTCATVELVCLHMRRFRSEGFMPVNTRTTGDKLIEFIPGMPSFSALDIPLCFYDEHPLIELVTKAMERLLEADWILSSTFQKLEAHTLDIFHNHFGAKQYLPIGPFLPDSHVFPVSDKTQDRLGLSPDALTCLEWLDSRPDASVLYVSFGSIAVVSGEQFLELVAGLEMSKLDVLWVVRPNLVMTGFPQEEFDKSVGRSEGRFHVSAWAPQMHVLRHAAVGGFLTHCGWNSVLESLCAGVPMIGWPCMSEQNSNCSFLAKNRLGLQLEKSGASGLYDRLEIGKAVSDLMKGDIGKEIRQNVKMIGDEARKALMVGGSSDANLNAFANNFF